MLKQKTPLHCFQMMAPKKFANLSFVFLLCLIVSSWFGAYAHDDERKVGVSMCKMQGRNIIVTSAKLGGVGVNLIETYIIYMGDRVNLNISAESLHLDMLSRVLERVSPHKVSEHLLYTYGSFHGCVAKLTEKEAKIIAGMDDVVSVFPNDKNYRRTTRSWDFMKFTIANVQRSNSESDIIIGVIDNGIWPESPSFQDNGLGPPPSKWKGGCDTSHNFTCNKKIIGARYFRADGNFSKDDIASPRDTDGHGTHTASTAAGIMVEMACFQGLGLGTARGGVPSARIAVYKSCWSDGCYFSDILAAFDTAISDGVDIISISLGNTLAGARPYFSDPIAIGAFHAMKSGILTSSSAGNDGPSLQTVENVAPWLLVVGASTIDRKFSTKVQLQNGLAFEGISVNTFDLQKKKFPLIYGGDAPDMFSNSSYSRYCVLDTLNITLVKNKIVLCDYLASGRDPFLKGAAGMIMRDVEPHDVAYTFPLPASYLRVDDASLVLSYTRNVSSTPYGSILKSVEVNDTLAPYVASFSARGPHPFSPGILKPDLVAPGVHILAAWSPVASVSGVTGDPRSVTYNIISGTSMACPHATAIAAYVKSFHPTWSEAAIKSALMTTALTMSNAKNEEAELAYGSGQVNPLQAIDPGLVYDADVGDYVKFLCAEGLEEFDIKLIAGESISCKNITKWDLNYPSIALATSSGSFSSIFRRTVTNVGSPNSTYHAIVKNSQRQALAIHVEPSILQFNSLGQKKPFTVRISGTIGIRALISASLEWNDGQHQVRSPIIVFNLS